DSRPNLRTGGQILVDQLRIHGVDTIFCVPGESYLASLDALYDARDQIRLVVCRQEGGASYMADAYAKLTGKPGVCFVTRGPGAANASLGIHTARQDSTPVVLLIGQVARGMMGREAFQEVDFRKMFEPLAKWVEQIDDPARVPEMISRAFHVATSGRPGPVVLALPEDMQREPAAASDAAPYRSTQASPAANDMEALRATLARAKRPVMILGGGGWTGQACADITAFAEANLLPTGAAFRRQDLIDNRLPVYIGDIGVGMNPALAKRLKESDTLLVVGAQLGEVVTEGYSLFDIPRPKQTLIHVCAGVEELGKVYQPDVAINAGMEEFAAAARALDPIDGGVWGGWLRDARGDLEANIAAGDARGDPDLAHVMIWLRENLKQDSIITNGAGNFAAWVHRYYVHCQYGTQLAPQSGSMGYAVPAAVAAKLARPECTVVAITGDGDFMMNGQEFATAVQYGAAIICVVVNNGVFGTIRMHQERDFPGRISGTELVNPDFAALAKAYGAFGEVVEHTADFAGAFGRAQESGGPALIELRVEQDIISPRATLSGLRKAAQAK
ncbi:MAG: thiamine pyrophosphate-binding protein, partial [Alphaproteobacteria bacterium]